MDSNLVILLLGAMGGLGGLAAVLTAVFSKRKLTAEGDLFVVQAANSLTSIAMRHLTRIENDMKDLNDRLTDYRTRLEAALIREKELEGRVTLLQNRVAVLEGYIAAHGLTIPNGEGT